jgi:truncated hemoglobin YjbI
MVNDLAMNAYLSGYIAALRSRHRPGVSQAENPFNSDPAQRDGWLDGFKDATDEFGGVPTRQSIVPAQGTGAG